MAKEDVATLTVSVRDAYKRAEDMLHVLAIDAEGADTAAINELRYAGYHVLKALSKDNEAEVTEELRRAYRHCLRAFYEVCDGAVFYYLLQYQQFKRDYATVVVSDVVPNYLDIEKRMIEAKRVLQEARSGSGDRDDHYQIFPDITNSLKADIETLDAARDELNKKLSAAKASLRNLLVQWTIPFLAALLGAGTIVLTTRLGGLWPPP